MVSPHGILVSVPLSERSLGEHAYRLVGVPARRHQPVNKHERSQTHPGSKDNAICSSRDRDVQTEQGKKAITAGADLGREHSRDLHIDRLESDQPVTRGTKLSQARRMGSHTAAALNDVGGGERKFHLSRKLS